MKSIVKVIGIPWNINLNFHKGMSYYIGFNCTRAIKGEYYEIDKNI